MAKILLTSIGKGARDKDNSQKYITTNYSEHYGITDLGQTVRTAFVYEALMKFKKYDKIIFIGTAGSNWAALYDRLFDESEEYVHIKPKLEKDISYL